MIFRVFKRMFDFVSALLLLIAISPVIFFVGFNGSCKTRIPGDFLLKKEPEKI